MPVYDRMSVATKLVIGRLLFQGIVYIARNITDKSTNKLTSKTGTYLRTKG